MGNSPEIRIRRELRHEYPSHTTGTIINLLKNTYIYITVKTNNKLVDKLSPKKKILKLRPSMCFLPWARHLF
jgi:hypothetical protein